MRNRQAELWNQSTKYKDRLAGQGEPGYELPWSNLSRAGKDGQKMCFNGDRDVTASYKHTNRTCCVHDDVIKWKHFPRYWLFVRVIHRSPVTSPHKSQWRGTLMFSLIWAWINGWVNNHEAGDLRRHHAHDGVILMIIQIESRTKLHPTNTSHTICNGMHTQYRLRSAAELPVLAKWSEIVWHNNTFGFVYK